MRIELPDKVSYLISELNKAGFDAYAVGGCVRDAILGRTPEDWDVTTPATPKQVKNVFRGPGIFTVDTGIEHGTVTVMMDGEGFEVTTYRLDGHYDDARHPSEVTYTDVLTEDLKRRDFTINAMAYNEDAGLVDAFDGLDDLNRGVIRCVGNPEERFGEDALRMMRAVRFAAQLGFAIDADTRAAIPKLADNLSLISAERIRTELVKLLISPHPDAMREVWETGMADVFLPEFSRLMETEQNNPHHCGTVGEHTIRSLMEVDPDPVLRLTMLFHDIAKPYCVKKGEDGFDHFHGHPRLGAEMTREIMRRLKFDNDTIARVCALVAAHDDRPYPPTKQAVRRSIYRNGVEQYPALFAVKRADILAQSDYLQKEKLEYMDEYEAVYDQIMEAHDCLSRKDLAVTGSDLIEAGIKPGKEMGQILSRMLEDVIDEPSLNEKQILLARLADGKYADPD
ncbi:MAG: HD domain-containing protein [Lachnospiraceae bacterium]|nr:HD domain-containing protein [Lachnospiraceae bacterium]